MNSSVALQVEWSKAHARAQRYIEEVDIVLEEMRRVLQYFRWKANWWRNNSGVLHAESSVHLGCQAYATKQAFQLDSLHSKFLKIWEQTIGELSLEFNFVSPK